MAQLLLFDVPLVVLIVGLPVVWYKRRSQMLNRVGHTQNIAMKDSTLPAAKLGEGKVSLSAVACDDFRKHLLLDSSTGVL